MIYLFLLSIVLFILLLQLLFRDRYYLSRSTSRLIPLSLIKYNIPYVKKEGEGEQYFFNVDLNKWPSKGLVFKIKRDFETSGVCIPKSAQQITVSGVRVYNMNFGINISFECESITYGYAKYLDNTKIK